MSEESLRGEPLSDADYVALEPSWITRDLADQAMLRRVSTAENGMRRSASRGML